MRALSQSLVSLFTELILDIENREIDVKSVKSIDEVLFISQQIVLFKYQNTDTLTDYYL